MNIKANKKLGQNFLTNTNVLKNIVATANLEPNDLVLEIGPGTGILTKALIDAKVRVIAIEKDPRMEKVLFDSIDSDKLTLIVGDIREYYTTFLENNQEEFKLIANIPYYLSSFLIRMIFNEDKKPIVIILMAQKEWAERITLRNQPNNKLSMFANLFFETEYIMTVKKDSFRPAPKVDSAIIKLSRKNKVAFGKEMIAKYEKMVNACFRQPRKILKSNLKNYFEKDLKYENIFKQLNINEKSRPEEISFDKYIELLKIL